MSVVAILLILALVCFVMDAFGVAVRVNLTPLGLALVTLAILLGNG